MNRTLSFALGSSSVTAEWTTADVSHLHDRVGEILHGRDKNIQLLRGLAEWPAAAVDEGGPHGRSRRWPAANGRREPARLLRCYF